MINTIHKIIREDVKTFINTDYSFPYLISEDDEHRIKLKEWYESFKKEN